ncbi:hypothetical protein K474DRAFT_1392903 [Panus rudis PR-1116 ss-1]|nr:hypothetical protein K474DRAFT_1392903 [Panus rudis PR-1116 ss-1]
MQTRRAGDSFLAFLCWLRSRMGLKMAENVELDDCGREENASAVELAVDRAALQCGDGRPISVMPEKHMIRWVSPGTARNLCRQRLVAYLDALVALDQQSQGLASLLARASSYVSRRTHTLF